MRRIWVLAAVTLVLTLWVHGQGKQPAKASEFKIPEADAKRENPIKTTPAGLEAGKKLYGTECTVCHGKDGDGKGDLAGDMKVKPRDWRDPASLEKMTDGEIFYIITKGKGEMLGEEARMKPDQCWQLVNYVRSLVKKDSSAGKKP